MAPARQLHVYAHDTPGIRLEDHATQSFDLGLIESCFCIVDVTDGTEIPFTICPNAPTDSMFIASTGHVGFGTSSPQTLLHARKPAEVSTAEILARFDVADDANGRLEISNVSSTNGIFHPRLRGTTSAQAVCLTMEGIIADDFGSNPVVSFAAAKSAGGSVVNRPLVTFRNNVTVRATIAANGDVFATSFNPTSSRSTKDNIVDLDSVRAADALRTLTPVEYVYKDDPTAEQRVGFIAEDVPEIVANADRKSVPIMDVLALVTRVVKYQQQTIDEQKKLNDELKMANDAQRTLNEELLNRLNQLERQMQEKK